MFISISVIVHLYPQGASLTFVDLVVSTFLDFVVPIQSTRIPSFYTLHCFVEFRIHKLSGSENEKTFFHHGSFIFY